MISIAQMKVYRSHQKFSCRKEKNQIELIKKFQEKKKNDFYRSQYCKQYFHLQKDFFNLRTLLATFVQKLLDFEYAHVGLSQNLTTSKLQSKSTAINLI